MDDLRARLDRWVAAGAIRRDQADAILAVEGQPRDQDGRRTVIAEVLGYIGGILALVAGIVIGAESFSQLNQAGKVTFLAVVTLVLLVPGWWLRAARNDTLRRLGSLLWLLSVAGFASTLYTALDEVQPLGVDADVLSAAGALALGIALWLLERRALQQVGLFVSAIATIALIADNFNFSVVGGWSYLILGAAWIGVSLRDLVPPRRTAEAFGALSIGLGTEVLWNGTDNRALLLGLAISIALVVIGSALLRTVLLGLGAAGLLVFLSQLAIDNWTTLGAPLALLLIGLGLIAAAILLARAAGRSIGTAQRS